VLMQYRGLVKPEEITCDPICLIDQDACVIACDHDDRNWLGQKLTNEAWLIFDWFDDGETSTTCSVATSYEPECLCRPHKGGLVHAIDCAWLAWRHR
jgi:hypothetical protein